MPQMDGSIRIGTKIETKEAERELKGLESSITKTADKIASLRSKMDALKDAKLPTQEYQEISNQISKAEQKFNKLLEKQEQMQREGKDSGVVWERLNYQIEEAWNEIRYAQSELQDLVDTGRAFTLGSDTDKYAQMTVQMEQLTNKMQSDQQREAEIQSALTAEEERLAQIKANATVSDQQMLALLERRKQLTQEIADMERAGVGLGYKEYDLAQQELSGINDQLKECKANIDNIPERFSKVRNAVTGAFNALASGVRKGNSLIESAFVNIGRAAKKTFNAIAGGTKKANASLSGGFKTILKYGFGIRSLYVLFNKIRSGIKEGFSNLINYSTDFANSVQSMKNAMSTLSNQIAAAFAPIVQLIIPWLTKLISVISTAMTYVAQFIAILGGKSTFVRAKQVQDGYNKSLGDTAAAAKKAYGALAKFDDLDVLQKQEEDADIGGGAADAIGDLFEEAPISDKIKDFFDWLKEMWENSDFYELGKLLGEKLKEALDSIPWDEIKEIARKIGKSIVSFINGFIEVEGLGESIGRTLAEVINTAFEFLNAFVHELHWDSIGKFIAETINGFFTNIDWDLIYDTFITGAKGLGDAINSFVNNINWSAISTSVSNFFNTFIDTIYTFITTVNWAELGIRVGKAISDAFVGIDWSKAGETVGEAFKAFFDFIANVIEAIDWWAVGESVKDFLVGIDWAGVAESFFEAVGAALGGFAAFLGGLISEGVENAREYFEDKIEEAGGNVVEGILVGIAEALVGIGDWINEHIFTPFIEGFKSAFGIHSPSTIMEEMGGFIVQGLLNGLDVFEEIKEAGGNFIEGIKEGIDSKWESLKSRVGEVANSIVEKFKDRLGIHSPSTVMTEQGEYITEGLLNGIAEKLHLVSELWVNLKEDMISVLESMGTWFTDFWAGLFDNVSVSLENIQLFFLETWTALYETTVEIWTVIQEWFVEYWIIFIEYLTETWENILLIFIEKWEEIQLLFNDFIDFLNTVFLVAWIETWQEAGNQYQIFHDLLAELSDAIKKMMTFFMDNMVLLVNTKWKNAWDNAKNIFVEFEGRVEEIIDELRGIIQEFYDWVMSLVEEMIAAIESVGSAIGSAGSASTGLSGGGRISVHNIVSAPVMDVPHLASGSVIRGGNPFIAMLGDQPHGQTNIEAPLSTIEQAVDNVMNRRGNSGGVPVNINLNWDGETFARISIPDFLAELARQGYDVDVLGVT